MDEINTTETQLTAVQRRDLLIALGELPYGGLVMHRMPRSQHDDAAFIEQTVDALRGLAVELRKISERNDQREQELQQLQRERDAVRSFLGIEQLTNDLTTVAADLSAFENEIDERLPRREGAFDE